MNEQMQAAQEDLAAVPHSAIDDGRLLVAGEPHMRDGKGRLVPVSLIKAQHQLEDETVRKIFGYAVELSEQIRRFREHTLFDIAVLLGVLDQEYGDHRGGVKGNVTLLTFDGLMKVQLQVADLIAFGPELQTAKHLVDECLAEWSSDSRPEIRAIIQRAFDVEKEGAVNRSDLLSLLRLAIEDERWTRAMAALRDSMRPVGTKEYVRFYRRAKPNAKWEAVSIDVAAA